MDDGLEMGRGVLRRKTASNLTFCVKKDNDGKYRKVYAALQKKEEELTEEEQQLVLNNADLVKKARESLKKREEVKARSEEFEDPNDVLLSKCAELAAALRNSNHLVVYTGAGISTAAKIPDYRGSNGIWTLLQKGKDIGKHDLSRAEPTRTHMALFELYSQGILKYAVSQNCDGLHLRSGLPRSALSEVHGNMHLEICQTCRPSTQYWRMFDVTENTGRFSHRTMRRCHICHSALIDTIVHFGERGNLPWPLNWPAASKAADNADTILCIGSSLKVLKKYPWLWGMDKPVKKRPKLYIINLQWTPKDDQAVLKINGRCDRVMEEVMKSLNLKIPEYSRLRDPIFSHATHLHPDEIHTTSQPELNSPFKTEDRDVGDKLDVTEQGVKRSNAFIETDFPAKVRKLENESDSSFIIKQEPQDGSGLCTNNIEELCRLQSLPNGTEIAKQEPFDAEYLIVNSLPFVLGFETSSLLLSSEEVVAQINIGTDTKNVNDTTMHSKENDVLISFSGEKKDDHRNPMSSGSCPLLIASDLSCSKLNIENLTADIDGKENVAVCFPKECHFETGKSAKKAEAEKTSDVTNGSQIMNHGVQSMKTESKSDCIVLLRGQKLNGKHHGDVPEDEVGVLKMLQLEHNYSKVLDENIDNKSSDLKDVMQDVTKELKDVKNDSKELKKDLNEVKKDIEEPRKKAKDLKTGSDMRGKQEVQNDCTESKKDVKTKPETRKNLRERKEDMPSTPESSSKRNLRRISRDTVNYVEEDEDDDEEEEEEEEDDDEDNRSSNRQSVRTSRRVQEKQHAKQPDKQNIKHQAKLENKKNVEVEKKRAETSCAPVKPNKPPTPLKNKKLTKADFEMRAELKSRTCYFCLIHYKSKICMFYPSLDFRPRQFEGCICECCDYSSDSEEADDDASNAEINEGKGDSTDNADEGCSKSSVINPGWYGKGYRKRCRKRK